jgi:DNA-binding transcriptional LysR family regulator
MDVHLRDLRWFLAVAEEGSVTRAAERVYVSQPALSKRIARLERDLGTPLLTRGHRSIALTRAGEALVPRAAALLADWDAARRESLAAAREAGGEIVVGLQTAVGRGIYARAAPAMARAHPGVRLSLRSVRWDDPTAGLADGTSDLALVWLPLPAEAGLQVRVLSAEPRMVALPADHPLARRPRLRMADLLDEPFVALPPEAGALRDFWLAVTERGGREPVVGAVAMSPDDTFEMIAGGAGIALVSAGNAEIYAREGLAFRPLDGVGGCELAVAWRRGEGRAEVIALVELLSAAASAP